MAISFKDFILTILGIGVGFGAYMGTVELLGVSLAALLGIASFLLVAGMDYLLYFAKIGRERAIMNNVICDICFNVTKSKFSACPSCGNSF